MVMRLTTSKRVLPNEFLSTYDRRIQLTSEVAAFAHTGREVSVSDDGRGDVWAYQLGGRAVAFFGGLDAPVLAGE